MSIMSIDVYHLGDTRDDAAMSAHTASPPSAVLGSSGKSVPLSPVKPSETPQVGRAGPHRRETLLYDQAILRI